MNQSAPVIPTDADMVVAARRGHSHVLWATPAEEISVTDATAGSYRTRKSRYVVAHVDGRVALTRLGATELFDRVAVVEADGVGYLVGVGGGDSHDGLIATTRLLERP